ncbi:MAG: type II toxin-antitoxin system RelE/ParE family toxin [Bryobacteraceae bacterium]
MACDVEFTDEFGDWWGHLTAEEQASVRAYVKLLEEYGVALRYPYCSRVETSRHDHMRELRVQHAGRPYRVLYAFDPRRTAILLIGGDKTGSDRWYDTFVPLADRIYSRYLEQLRKEGES